MVTIYSSKSFGEVLYAPTSVKAEFSMQRASDRRFWSVSFHPNAQMLDWFSDAGSRMRAVCDDFGNLVRVQ